MAFHEPIVRLIKEFSLLPGIGEKSAERLTFHLLGRTREDVLRLADAIHDLKEKLRFCHECQDVTEIDPCHICNDPKRDHTTLLVVEHSKDLWALEKTGAYRGLYHVLNGRIAPLDGVGPDQLTIRALCSRINPGAFREVILGTNPNAEGDATAYFIQDQLKEKGVRVTRIARGLPVGGSIEYANRSILTEALQGRRDLA